MEVYLLLLYCRYSVTFNRDKLIKRSNDAQDSLKRLREVASLNGNEVQIEILKQKLAKNAKYKDKT